MKLIKPDPNLRETPMSSFTPNKLHTGELS